MQVSLPEQQGPLESGELSFVDNTVDAKTGTINLKGQFANADARLWPGEFVNTTLVLREHPGAILVPSQAVQTGQQGSFVFVVQPSMKAEIRPVVIGESIDNQTVVTSGLKAGETVVTDGQLRLIPGSTVTIKSGLTEQRRRIMNIAEAFIRRPVMTTLSSLAIVLFGLMAYRYLPVNDLPNVDFPTIVVSASLPGASPETMASSVATPLEKQFSTIAGPRLDDLDQHPGLDQHHAAIQPDAQYRRRRAGRAGGDRGDASATAAGDAESAVVSAKLIPPISRSCTWG